MNGNTSSELFEVNLIFSELTDNRADTIYSWGLLTAPAWDVRISSKMVLGKVHVLFANTPKEASVRL